MTNEFEKRHNIAATPDDVRRIRKSLTKFYAAVRVIDPLHDGWIQLHDGPAMRAAFEKHNTTTPAAGVSIALDEMPMEWPPRYRALVMHHLARLLDEGVNSSASASVL